MPNIVFAAAETTADTGSIEWFVVVVGLFGGLALFLLGMQQMTDALRLVAGARARSMLERLTSNRIFGLFTGAGITAVVQSSSVTTVLVVGFISAGLMNLIQAVPVIFGSNVGTTITAQVIAFDVSAWALVLVAGGFLASNIAKRETRKAQATAVMGLGLVFFGMVVMSEAVEPLRGYEPFISAMESLDNLILGIIVGAVFTAIVQSSSATTGVVIVLASQGLITLEAGIALILGANIGTSVTAVLAGIGKPREAQRAAAVHVLFNVIGVVLWIPFVGLLASFVERIGGGVPREIANAHTIFNVANAFIFLPFVSVFAGVATRILPDTPDDGLRARYIDPTLLDAPQVALAKARMEMLRMAARVQGMLVDVLPAILDGNIDDLNHVEELDDEVDQLHGVILEFLGQLSQKRLSEASSAELVDLFEATNALEAVGDIVETNLVALGHERIQSGVEVSLTTRELISRYHEAVVEAFEMALIAVTQKDQEAAHRVSNMKKRIRNYEREVATRQAERLVAEEPNRIATYRFENDVITNLKRTYYFTRRIARVAVPEQEQSQM